MSTAARSSSGFGLGARSRAELEGVHPSLVEVVELAIELTDVDFAVHDGLRTEAEQREYVRTGVSRTMASKHLPQDDGLGHAVDLVPWINGRLRWEWEPIYRIARAVHRAAAEAPAAAGWSLRWGAVWDRGFHTLNRDDLEREVAQYAARMRAQGRKAFLDGPHFELMTPTR